MVRGHTELGVVTGKRCHSRLAGTPRATGARRTVRFAGSMQGARDGFEGRRVAVQGFGNAVSIIGAPGRGNGARVVAACDSAGVYSATGIDIGSA